MSTSVNPLTRYSIENVGLGPAGKVPFPTALRAVRETVDLLELWVSVELQSRSVQELDRWRPGGQGVGVLNGMP